MGRKWQEAKERKRTRETGKGKRNETKGKGRKGRLKDRKADWTKAGRNRKEQRKDEKKSKK